MRAERPTVLVIPHSVKVIMISTLQRLSSVHSLWHPPAAAYVYYSWLNESVKHDTTPGHQAPAQVNPCRLLVLPVKTPLYIVPVSAAHCHCPCMSNIKLSCRSLDMCPIQCFTRCSQDLQCTGQWSARTASLQPSSR